METLLFAAPTLLCRGAVEVGGLGALPLDLACWIMIPSKTSDRLTSNPKQQQQQIYSGKKGNGNEDKHNQGNSNADKANNGNGNEDKGKNDNGNEDKGNNGNEHKGNKGRGNTGMVKRKG